MACVARALLPATSRARTRTVCTPGARPENTAGLVHVEDAPPSRAHSNACTSASGSFAEGHGRLRARHLRDADCHGRGDRVDHEGLRDAFAYVADQVTGTDAHRVRALVQAAERVAAGARSEPLRIQLALVLILVDVGVLGCERDRCVVPGLPTLSIVTFGATVSITKVSKSLTPTLPARSRARTCTVCEPSSRPPNVSPLAHPANPSGSSSPTGYIGIRAAERDKRVVPGRLDTVDRHRRGHRIDHEGLQAATPTLPTRSRARTLTVCEPSSRPPNVSPLRTQQTPPYCFVRNRLRRNQGC